MQCPISSLISLSRFHTWPWGYQRTAEYLSAADREREKSTHGKLLLWARFVKWYPSLSSTSWLRNLVTWLLYYGRLEMWSNAAQEEREIGLNSQQPSWSILPGHDIVFHCLPYLLLHKRKQFKIPFSHCIQLRIMISKQGSFSIRVKMLPANLNNYKLW